MTNKKTNSTSLATRNADNTSEIIEPKDFGVSFRAEQAYLSTSQQAADVALEDTAGSQFIVRVQQVYGANKRACKGSIGIAIPIEIIGQGDSPNHDRDAIVSVLVDALGLPQGKVDPRIAVLNSIKYGVPMVKVWTPAQHAAFKSDRTTPGNDTPKSTRRGLATD